MPKLKANKKKMSEEETKEFPIKQGIVKIVDGVVQGEEFKGFDVGCATCKGTGRHLPELTCPACNGTGRK